MDYQCPRGKYRAGTDSKLALSENCVGWIVGGFVFYSYFEKPPVKQRVGVEFGVNPGAIVSSVYRESETGNDGVGVGDVNPYLWYCLMPCGESQQLTG